MTPLRPSAPASAKVPEPRWWEARPARNLKAATYRCPFCDRLLSSMSEHLLIAPEGNTALRRHAHRACVLSARSTGRLPTRDEWRAANRRTGIFDRLRPWGRRSQRGQPAIENRRESDRAPLPHRAESRP